MNTKFVWLKKNYMRFLWLMLSILYIYATIEIWAKYADHDYPPNVLFITSAGAVVFLVFAIFRHINIISRFERYCTYLGLMVPPVYLMASAVLAVLTAIGWDGCVFRGESYWVCSGRIENVWRLFPTSSPFHEMTYLWGKGFGGGHELYFALATAMFMLGLSILAIIFDDAGVSFTSAVLTTSVLVASCEIGFYFVYTITQSRGSWPGVVISAFALVILLMMDRWYKKSTSSKDSEEKKDVVTSK
jgi:hypothetical protein